MGAAAQTGRWLPRMSPAAGINCAPCRFGHVVALLLIVLSGGVAKESGYAGGESFDTAAVESLPPRESQCCPLEKRVSELDCEMLAGWLRCIGVASTQQSTPSGVCLLNASAVSSHSVSALREAGLTHSEAHRVVTCRSLGTAGVVYVLWDLDKVARLVDLAQSVSSVRRVEEGLGIVLFVAPASEGAGSAQEAVRDADATVADILEQHRVEILDLPLSGGVGRNTGLKLLGLQRSPFDRTLLLDSDTLVRPLPAPHRPAKDEFIEPGPGIRSVK